MKTKDYGLTCLLLCKGHEIQNYKSDATGQMWFEFNDIDEVKKIEDDFFMNRALVSANDFLSAQKRIKNIIFRGNEHDYRKSER